MDKPVSIKDATTSLAATLSNIDEHIAHLEGLRDRLIGATTSAQPVNQPFGSINPPSGSILDGISALERLVTQRLDKLQALLTELDHGI